MTLIRANTVRLPNVDTPENEVLRSGAFWLRLPHRIGRCRLKMRSEYNALAVDGSNQSLIFRDILVSHSPEPSSNICALLVACYMSIVELSIFQGEARKGMTSHLGDRSVSRVVSEPACVHGNSPLSIHSFPFPKSRSELEEALSLHVASTVS
jgi:hypothetical protein